MMNSEPVKESRVLDDFDPISDSYNDSLFNNYDNGYAQGGYDQRQELRHQGAVIYVKKIPLSMNEEGLRNMFSQCGKVLKVDGLHKPKTCDFKVGKVCYGFTTEAVNAISRFNGKRPFNLVVQHDRTATNVGDGNNQRASVVNNRSQPVRGEHHQGGLLVSRAQANNNFGRGRGAGAGDIFQKNCQANFKSASGDCQRNTNSSQLSFLCSGCSRTAIYKCSRCRQVYYCSDFCQKKDWFKHKTECYINETNDKTASMKNSNGGSRSFESIPQRRNGADVPKNTLETKQHQTLSPKDLKKRIHPHGGLKPLMPHCELKPLMPHCELKPLMPHCELKPLMPHCELKPLMGSPVYAYQPNDRCNGNNETENKKHEKSEKKSSDLPKANAKKKTDELVVASTEADRFITMEANAIPNELFDSKFLPLEKKTMVVVTNTNNPWDFYVARCDEDGESRQLHADVQREASSAEPLSRVSVGQIVGAKSSHDGCFYRAIVKEIKDSSTICIFYVDYGDSETRVIGELRLLSNELSNRPIKVMSCRLVNVNPKNEISVWTIEACKDFMNYVAGPVIAINIETIGQQNHILLMNQDEYDVGEMLCEANHAVKKSYGPRQPIQTSSLKRDISKSIMNQWKVGDEISLSVSICDGELEIYMQDMNVCDEDLNRFINMNAMCNLAPKMSCTGGKVGTVVCALSPSDNDWYRAIIRSIDGECITVRYLDFGNVETVFTVCQVPDELMQIPSVGFQAIFDNSDECTKVKTGLTADGLIVNIIEVGKDEAKIKIIHAAESIVASAFSVWHGKFSMPMPTPTSLPLTLTSDVTTNELHVPNNVNVKPMFIDASNFVHVIFDNKESHSGLQRLRNSLKEECEKNAFTLSTLPLLNQLVCAKYTVDNEWYRAEVVAITSKEAVEIRYIDYGNLETLSTNRLKPLSPRFLDLPPFALSVQLQISFPVDARELNQVLCVDNTGPWKMTVMDKTARPVLVQLSKDETTLEQMLTKRRPQDEIKCNAIQLEVGKSVELCISNVEKNVVCCFPYDEKVIEDLDVLNNEIGVWCEKSSPPEKKDFMPKHGQLLLAKSKKHSGWYRAWMVRIMERGAIQVLFADYGNLEFVDFDDLRPMRKEFCRIDLQCVRCTLEGIECKKPAQEAQLLQLLNDDFFLVDVVEAVGVESGTYKIRIPSLESELKAIGVL